MPPPLLQLKDIVLTFGGTPLLSGAELSVSTGERVCLVGRNGSGKSTLLKIAAGQVEPQDGTIFRQPSTTVRYLPQEPDLDGFADVAAYVAAGLGPGDEPHRVTYLLDHLGLFLGRFGLRRFPLSFFPGTSGLRLLAQAALLAGFPSA